MGGREANFYSKVRDAAQIYEIKTKISSTKHGSRYITEYSNLLQNLWLERIITSAFK